jgi:hypothetical protein
VRCTRHATPAFGGLPPIVVSVRTRGMGVNHDVTVRAIRTKRGLSFIDIEQQE